MSQCVDAELTVGPSGPLDVAAQSVTFALPGVSKRKKPKNSMPPSALSSSSSSSPHSSVANQTRTFSDLQQAYAEWMKYRRIAIPLFQDLVNAKNMISHVKQNKTAHLGLMASSNKISMQVYDEISDVALALDEVQHKMLEVLSTIENIQSNLILHQAIPVEESFLVELLEQLRNQTSLEVTMLSRIRELRYGGEKDQDLSVTLMACLTYPPYFRKDDLKQILELKPEKENK